MKGTCAECGLDADSLSVSDAIAAMRSFPRRWRGAFAIVGDEEGVLSRRPSPDVWSANEYVAHTRDTIAANGWLLARTVTEDHPVIDWPDDETLTTRPPGEVSDPATMLDELAANCERVASRAERTDAGDWRRPATIRGAPEESVDALWFLRHCVHEGAHHLRDVKRVIETVLAAH